VHRGPKGGANLESSFDALRFGLPRRSSGPSADKDTSAAWCSAHRKATASLGLLFKHGRISKTYWAVIEGGPAEDEGTIDLRSAASTPSAAGAEAGSGGTSRQSPLEVLGRGGGLTSLSLGSHSKPVTGRTHQLRVHSPRWAAVVATIST